jgi:hypothetical protein
MPKLNDLLFQFRADEADETINGGALYRHRLYNPLWRWATEKMKDK